MISGPQALADIERAIADTRAKEGELDAVLASATAEAQRLRQSQTDAFRALARMRLDALAGEAISGRLEATERRALQLMDAARQTLADLAARRAAATAAVEEQERVLAATRRAVATVDDEIDRLTAETAARGKADPAWIAAKARLDEATRVAAEAEKKAATAEADRRAKGAPYEADPLFMYLWTRRFGTSDYKAGNLVRYLDRKVAALVGFVEARPNYAVLTEIPLRMREHAERRKAAVTAAETELSALERSFLVADGIEAVEARRSAAQAEADRVDAVLKAARDHLATAEQEHALARDGGDKGGFAEAVDLIAGEMAREDLQELYKAAFATPDPRDEKIVRQIESLIEAIAKADREIADIRAEARAIAGRRGQIETVRDDFRRKGYDRPEARFGNEQMIGQILGGIIGGALTSPDLWRVLLDGFSERPRHRDTGFGGGRRFPGPGPGGFGGGGGGGDNRGGGGFTTGGGF